MNVKFQDNIMETIWIVLICIGWYLCGLIPGIILTRIDNYYCKTKWENADTRLVCFAALLGLIAAIIYIVFYLSD